MTTTAVTTARPYAYALSVIDQARPTIRYVEDGIIPTRTELSVLYKGLIVKIDKNSFMFFLLVS